MVFDILVLSIIAACGLLFLLFKIAKPKKVLAFDWQIDAALTVLLCVGMAGTMMGIMIGIVTGAIVSVVLFCLKYFIFGADKLTMRGWQSNAKPKR